MIISPNQQKEQARIINNRIKIYKILYVITILFSAFLIVLFFSANYNLNHIQEDYYVYDNYKFKLNSEFDEDFSLFNTIVTDNIKPIIDTIQPTSDLKVVDLRKYFSDVKNQGGQASCLAFAMSAMMEYMIKINKSETQDFSEAFLYYKTREKTGEENLDIGCRFFYSIESLQKDGLCPERYMPYNEYDYFTAPTQNALDIALSYRIKDANKVNLEINDLKNVLQKGFPIAISIKMYSSFGNGQNGVVPLPMRRERDGGSHAMVIVGYNDNNSQFIVRNSWGDSFGDNGYCYIPYDYIANPDLTNYAWIIIL